MNFHDGEGGERNFYKIVPIDVEEEQVPQASVFTLRSRPLVGGSSVGPVSGGTGTLGYCALAKVSDAFDVGNREIHWIGYPSFRTGEVSSGFKNNVTAHECLHLGVGEHLTLLP